MTRSLFLALVVLFTSACVTTGGIDRSSVETDVSPHLAVDNPDVVGKKVNWGGEIVKITNLENETHLELLSYPVNSRGFPQNRKSSTGRVLVIHNEFLEPTDYRLGRFVTVVGTIDETREGKVGESVLRLPVLISDSLILLPVDNPRSWGPFFSVGVGIRL